MSAPVAFRNNYPDLFGPGMLPVLEEIFTNELEMHPMVREQIFARKSSDRDIWQSTELNDMNLFAAIAEGTEYSYTKPSPGFNKTLVHTKYGLGFSVSEEMIEDGKFDMVGLMTRKLAASGRESQEIQAMDIFNNGFGSQVAADSLSVFNSAHLAGANTFRNIPSVMSDLSESSLQTALADFETVFVGSTGIIKRIAPKVLLVHPSNKRYAMELVGSDGKPDTLNNNLNSIKSDGLIVVSSPHLTDTDSWYLLASPEETGLRLVERKPLATKAASPDAGFDTDSIKYKASYRESIAVTHAYGIYGNQGA